MIEIYEGRLGGGKSYSAVLRMIAHFLRGGHVCTNVEIFFDQASTPLPEPNPEGKAFIQDYIVKHWGLLTQSSQLQILTHDDILRLHEVVPSGTSALPVLCIVDEAHIQLGVREHARAEIKKLFDWLTQSRKYAVDLIFITQNAKNIDARIERLIQYVWRFRDFEKWLIPGLGKASSVLRFLTLGILDGKYILQSCFDYDGRTLANKAYVHKNPAIFALYDTNAILYDTGRTSAVAAPKKLSKAAKKGPSTMVKWVCLLAVVMIVVGGYFAVKTIGQVAQGKPATGKQASANAVSLAKAAAPVAEGRVASYEVRRAKWLAVTPGFLKTEGGVYSVGVMTADGMCEAIQDKIAKVRKPDGSILYIVGEDYAVPAAPPPVEPVAKPAGAIIIAPDNTKGKE